MTDTPNAAQEFLARNATKAKPVEEVVSRLETFVNELNAAMANSGFSFALSASKENGHDTTSIAITVEEDGQKTPTVDLTISSMYLDDGELDTLLVVDSTASDSRDIRDFERNYKDLHESGDYETVLIDIRHIIAESLSHEQNVKIGQVLAKQESAAPKLQKG